MNEAGIRETLLSVSGTTKVYAEFVPEKVALPAIAFSHITNGGSRVIKGNRVGLWDTWRVLIIAKKRSECNAISNALKTLDNTSNNHFKNIFVLADGDIPASPDDDTRTAFVDFKTYG